MLLVAGRRHRRPLPVRAAGPAAGGGGGRGDARVQGPLQLLAGQEVLAGDHQ